MTEADIPVVFIDDPDLDAWSRLQKALGDGLANAVLQTPDRRGSPPLVRGINQSQAAPVAEAHNLDEVVCNLLLEWRMPFETLMNRHWSLCENPYARAWFAPGMILLHEDPLGWVVDAQAEYMSTGLPLDLPSWAILMPKAKSNHEAMAHMGDHITLPHPKLLNGMLDRAAADEGHGQLCPLQWLPQARPAGQLDIIGLER